MKAKRIIAYVLSVVIVLGICMPMSVLADGATSVNPVIKVESIYNLAGNMVDVNVTIQNNPGILGAILELEYDDGLTLIDAASGDAFSSLTMTKPGNFVSPCNFLWDGREITSDDAKDGTILTLTFKIDDNAKVNDEYAINVSCKPDYIIDGNMEYIGVGTINGSVKVANFIPGDLNGDKLINTKDIALLRRHVAGGYEQTINIPAADVNNDNTINSTDIALVRRYIAGGYGVELVPSEKKCEHILTEHPYKEPTATEPGNIAYWSCSECDKLFSDKDGAIEVSEKDTVIEATVNKRLTVDIRDLDVVGNGDTNGNGFRDMNEAPLGSLFAGYTTYYNEDGRKVAVTALGAIDSLSNGDGTFVRIGYKAPDVYVNGVHWGDLSNTMAYDASALTSGMLTGTVEFALLDTVNATAEYDTIYITAAKPFVVDEVNTILSTVRGKLAGSSLFWPKDIYFDADDAAVEAALYDTDGEEMAWTDLKENDVLMLSYMATVTKDIYKAKLCDNVIEGRVESTYGSPGSIVREIMIDGKSYKVSPDLENYYDASYGTEVWGAAEHTLAAGDVGVFYLDHNNTIVFFQIVNEISENYGYVMATNAPASGFGAYQIKILTKDNEVKIFDFADKIRYSDGPSVITGYEVNSNWYNLCTGLDGSVITYNVNSEGQINALFKAGAYTFDSKDSDFTLYDAGRTLSNYNPEDMTFGRFRVDENTVIFYEDSMDLSESKVVTLSALTEGDILNNVDLYNVVDDEYIRCMIIRSVSVIGGNQPNAVFVTKMYETMDEDYNSSYKVVGYKGGEEFECTTEWLPYDDIIGKLVIPQYSLDGSVVGFDMIRETDYGSEIEFNPYSANPKSLYYGKLMSIDEDMLICDDYNKVIKMKNDANVYVYDWRKAPSGRGHYQIDANGYLGYDPTYGLYYGNGVDEMNLSVDVYAYLVNGSEAIDVVYVIR